MLLYKKANARECVQDFERKVVIQEFCKFNFNANAQNSFFWICMKEGNVTPPPLSKILMRKLSKNCFKIKKKGDKTTMSYKEDIKKTRCLPDS